MTSFLGDDFLLDTDTAKNLYNKVARRLPILDYHCHINAREIAQNRIFHDPAELWLEGDHYKWRLMRANGISEKFVTGDASSEDKFMSWAATLERAVGNPLYHWSHLELKRYFGYDGHLTRANAQSVWNYCRNAMGEGMSVRDILKRSNVALLCTTDDPADTLEWHKQLAEDRTLETVVLPAFRPDKVVNVELDGFCPYLERLSNASQTKIHDWKSLTDALNARMDFFVTRGCKLADHGLGNMNFQTAETCQLDQIITKRLNGEPLSEQEIWQYKTMLLLYFGTSYARRNWTMQLHFAAQRNNNARMLCRLGPDTGYDSIGPSVNLPDLAAFLNALEQRDAFPKTILYSLNPNDNAGLVSLMGCFQDGSVPGKLQHGSAWWFNDCRDGMEAQLKNLAAGGLLGNFVGMLTDSRSFLSYTRHEYFRRILCGLLGRWVENGEFPNDWALLKKIVEDISYYNSVTYFEFTQARERKGEKA